MPSKLSGAFTIIIKAYSYELPAKKIIAVIYIKKVLASANISFVT